MEKLAALPHKDVAVMRQPLQKALSILSVLRVTFPYPLPAVDRSDRYIAAVLCTIVEPVPIERVDTLETFTIAQSTTESDDDAEPSKPSRQANSITTDDGYRPVRQQNLIITTSEITTQYASDRTKEYIYTSSH